MQRFALGLLLLTLVPQLNIEAPPDLAAARARLQSFDPSRLRGVMQLLKIHDPGPAIRKYIVIVDYDIPGDLTVRVCRRRSDYRDASTVGIGASPSVANGSSCERYRIDAIEIDLRRETRQKAIADREMIRRAASQVPRNSRRAGHSVDTESGPV